MVYYIKITSLSQWTNNFVLGIAKDLMHSILKIKAIGPNQVTLSITQNSNSSRTVRRSICSIDIVSFFKNYHKN